LPALRILKGRASIDAVTRGYLIRGVVNYKLEDHFALGLLVEWILPENREGLILEKHHQP
jgi:hypothetical protein